jgi:hypothetical protein
MNYYEVPEWLPVWAWYEVDPTVIVTQFGSSK